MSVKQTLRRLKMGSCKAFVLFLVILAVLLSTAVATAYLWTTKTTYIQIEEPLTITNSPAIVRTHPGQNQTLDITIENAASVTYTVTLTFTLENATYQTQYVTFSNNTYTITPGTNQITAWMTTDTAAPNVTLQLSTQFDRY